MLDQEIRDPYKWIEPQYDHKQIPDHIPEAISQLIVTVFVIEGHRVMFGIRIQIFGNVDAVPKKKRGVQSFELIDFQVSVLRLREPLSCFSGHAGKGDVVYKNNGSDDNSDADPGHNSNCFIIDRDRPGSRFFLCRRKTVIILHSSCI